MPKTKTPKQPKKGDASRKKNLTPKQQKFADLYLELGNASEAYRRAYSAKRMSANAVNVEAQRLLKHPAVSLYISGIRQVAQEKAELNRTWVLDRLMRNARICMGEQEIKMKVFSKTLGNVIEIEACDRDASAANQALTLLGKELGMFVERVENINEKYVVGMRRMPTEDEFEKKHRLSASVPPHANGNGACAI